MQEITYNITSSLEWLKTIHQALKSTLIHQDLLTLHKSMGTGSIQVVAIQKGLFITFIKVDLKAKVKLIRNASPINDYFILNFYLSRTELSQRATKPHSSLKFRHCGILLSSSMATSETVIPSNSPIDVFNITFSKEWLKQNVLGSTTNQKGLNQMLSLDKPIYLFESLDPKFNQIYQAVQNAHGGQGKVWLTANVLNMLICFFDKIQKRVVLEHYWSINHQDIDKLMMVKEMIEQNWQDTPTNDTLAKLAGMSLSKFKKLFKQAFGKSPYQYHLSIKMNKAMELLSQDVYTVSEVGHLVGYSNLSQFSRVFKKTYQVLPSELGKQKKGFME